MRRGARRTRGFARSLHPAVLALAAATLLAAAALFAAGAARAQAVPGAPARPAPTRPGGAPPAAAAPAAAAKTTGPTLTQEGLVNLDFDDVDLPVVIDTIAKLTNKNFIYDDRVRGKVTIVSPTPIPIEQAYTVFESMLQVKGFTTVETPGGAIKIIPIRDAKETSVDTHEARRSTPDSDRFVTRLIPLTYIDADAIANTLKPLVSKEAALVAYGPTNTVILTDSASNIRRILSILEAIDVESYKEELAVIRLQYADASTLANQLSAVFGGEVTSAGGGGAGRVQRPQAPNRPPVATPVTPEGTPQRGQVRIITDDRTNALILLAGRSVLEEMRTLIRKLDVPLEGGGRIQVYYLKHADAEDLADTLNALLTGQSPEGGGGGGRGPGPNAGLPPTLRAAMTDLSNSVSSITADPDTNSLVIQASPEGFATLMQVIEKLDIERPQVLVEALIMEVDVTDSKDLGFNGVLHLTSNGNKINIGSITDSRTSSNQGTESTIGAIASAIGSSTVPGLITSAVLGNGSTIQAIIRAAATDNHTNVLSAPHILTADNEEAQILVGNNIPIITNRVQSATGVTTVAPNSTLATSVNVERQDIGVTLRVTPQITEGDTLRLEIFQEITDINSALQSGVGDVNQVGPALSNRRIENTVTVGDNETVVVGGLIGDKYEKVVNKVPWLGDIPFFGWLFKSKTNTITKSNLLVFLTPHIVRSPDDLEKASIGKREEFERRSQQALDQPVPERPTPVDHPIGLLSEMPLNTPNATSGALSVLDKHYPLERMREIERERETEKTKAAQARANPQPATHYVILAGTFADPQVARSRLTELVDAGFEGSLLSSAKDGKVLTELRVGPFASQAQAEKVSQTLRHSYDLTPRVVEESGDKQP
ncbi:MAG TPA: type II secretion system secretin GspD [Myxococcota bacterium]|nr:type II secretion system secretin GspD [Myxococcota bacterium]